MPVLWRFNVFLRTVLFAVVGCVLSFNSFAVSYDECFSSAGTGTPRPTGAIELYIDKQPYTPEAMRDNQLLKSTCNGSTCSPVAGTHAYQHIEGLEWYVDYENGLSVKGYALCGGGSRKQGTRYTWSDFSGSTYSRCLCSLDAAVLEWGEAVDNAGWYWTGTSLSGSNWIEALTNCRSNCPKTCAEIFANGTKDLRNALSDINSCDVFQTSNSGGGDTPTLNCGDDATQEGNTCVCNNSSLVWNETTNSCVINCGSDATLSGNTCVCNDNSLVWNGSACVVNCGNDATWNENQQACVCNNGAFEWNNGVCACSGGRSWDGEKCVCSDSNQLWNGQNCVVLDCGQNLYISTVDGVSSCAACDSGTYSPGGRATYCTDTQCEIGYYLGLDDDGETITCKQCEHGYVTDNVGAIGSYYCKAPTCTGNDAIVVNSIMGTDDWYLSCEQCPEGTKPDANHENCISRPDWDCEDGVVENTYFYSITDAAAEELSSLKSAAYLAGEEQDENGANPDPILNYSGDSYTVKPGRYDDYIGGLKWQIEYADGVTISGYSMCSANSWGTASASSPKTISGDAATILYAGYGCTCSFDKEHWFGAGSYNSNSYGNASGKNMACRENCPADCAKLVATNQSVRNSMFNGVCPKTITCEGNEIVYKDMTGDEEEHCGAFYFPFSITTGNMQNGDTFSFTISAAGEFYVDWGNGEVYYYNFNSTGNHVIEYTYSNLDTSSPTIRLGGNASAYMDPDEITAAISFASNNHIYEISGSLGEIFYTLNNGDQPLFAETFKDCENLSIIPEDLFDGIYGTAADFMFWSVFENCLNLSSITTNEGTIHYVPESMFEDITLTGSSISAMFEATSLSLTCPENMVPANFDYNSSEYLGESWYNVWDGGDTGPVVMCVESNEVDCGQDAEWDDGQQACVCYDSDYLWDGHACVEFNCGKNTYISTVNGVSACEPCDSDYPYSPGGKAMSCTDVQCDAGEYLGLDPDNGRLACLLCSENPNTHGYSSSAGAIGETECNIEPVCTGNDRQVANVIMGTDTMWISCEPCEEGTKPDETHQYCIEKPDWICEDGDVYYNTEFYSPEEPVNVRSWQDLIDNNIIKQESSSHYVLYENTRGKLDDYISDMGWSIEYKDKIVSGYSACATAEWGNELSVNTGYFTGIHNGCVCSMDKNTWVGAGVLTGDYSSLGDKNEYCRANCPALCAELAATDSSFRKKLFGTSCEFEESTCDEGEILYNSQCVPVSDIPGCVDGVILNDNIGEYFPTEPLSSYTDFATLKNEMGVITQVGNASDIQYKISSMDDVRSYLAGEEWTVVMDGIAVSGYALCGPRSWINDNKNKFMDVKSITFVGNLGGFTAYNGCSCGMDIDTNRWVIMGKNVSFPEGLEITQDGDWEQRMNECRSKCPALCAHFVATNANFRQTLLNGVCPTGAVFNNISCEVGEYLPANGIQCETCPAGSYCVDEQTIFNMSTTDQGIWTCDDETNGVYPNANTGSTSKENCYASVTFYSDAVNSTESKYYYEYGVSTDDGFTISSVPGNPTAAEGYVFAGWCEGSTECEDEDLINDFAVITVKGNKVYYPVFKEATCEEGEVYIDEYEGCVSATGTIRFELNGGVGCSNTTYNVNQVTQVNCTPTKTDYSFDGWFDSNNRLVTEIPSSARGVVVLYAHWSTNCESNKWLHVGKGRLCLSATKPVQSPSLAVKIDGRVYYAQMTPKSVKDATIRQCYVSHLYIKMDGTVYSVHDDTIDINNTDEVICTVNPDDD